jgi:hypothetical protein
MSLWEHWKSVRIQSAAWCEEAEEKVMSSSRMMSYVYKENHLENCFDRPRYDAN